MQVSLSLLRLRIFTIQHYNFKAQIHDGFLADDQAWKIDSSWSCTDTYFSIHQENRFHLSLICSSLIKLALEITHTNNEDFTTLNTFANLRHC